MQYNKRKTAGKDSLSQIIHLQSASTAYSSGFLPFLMMEQTDPRKDHRHTILVAGFDHQIIPHRTARLGNVFYPALLCPLDIVREREKGIRTQHDIFRV